MKMCFVTDDDSDYCRYVYDNVPNWYCIPVEQRRKFHLSLTHFALDIISKSEFKKLFGKYLLDRDIDNYSFENLQLIDV